MSENQLRGQIIKQSEQYAKLKKETVERKHLNDVKKDYDTRVKHEEKAITKKEKELMQMEMLEMELIKNLQNTQNMQKSAYSDLEKALMLQSMNEAKELGLFEGVSQKKGKKKKLKRNQSEVNTMRGDVVNQL